MIIRQGRIFFGLSLNAKRITHVFYMADQQEFECCNLTTHHDISNLKEK